MIPYAKQSISSEDVQSVAEALKQALITRGGKVAAFEESLARFCGARFAVAFNSGSSALLAAYKAVDVCSFDRLITTPNTFVATVAYPWTQKVAPIFIDIDRETGNLDLERLKDNINIKSSRGKTVVAPVHFAGLAVDMKEVEKQIKDPNTIIIEDAAHAFGSYYPDGSKVGSCTYSHMTIFSFHPAKTITTGEGGAVLTNDKGLHERLKRIRNNGIEKNENDLWFYEVKEASSNLHLTEMQAALGLSQLKRVDDFIQKRRKLVKRYREKLKSVPHVKLFTDKFDDKTAFHLFAVQIDFEKINTTREHVMQKLKDDGIGTQVHYIPVYKHPFMARILGDPSECFPNMEAYYSQTLSLPLYPDLTVDDVDRIAESIKNRPLA